MGGGVPCASWRLPSLPLPSLSPFHHSCPNEHLKSIFYALFVLEFHRVLMHISSFLPIACLCVCVFACVVTLQGRPLFAGVIPDAGRKLVVGMVGLPARGKSYLVRAVSVVMSWLTPPSPPTNTHTHTHTMPHQHHFSVDIPHTAWHRTTTRKTLSPSTLEFISYHDTHFF